MLALLKWRGWGGGVKLVALQAADASREATLASQ
jgi:hypothetical protein